MSSSGHDSDRDYNRYFDTASKSRPLPDAMSHAVGGMYLEIGAIERQILEHFGLKDGMTLVDLGCGSGRLSTALSTSSKVNFIGTDVVQELLDHAAKLAPPHFKFVRAQGFTVPAPSATVDMISAFSLFTHLLHHETYIYLQDCRRALKLGGKMIFSFLEFSAPTHWAVFTQAVTDAKSRQTSHSVNSSNETRSRRGPCILASRSRSSSTARRRCGVGSF